MTTESEAIQIGVHTELWAVNILGPDDVFAVQSRAEAIELAQRFNTWWSETLAPRAAADPDYPTMWAVPTTWRGSPASHSANLSQGAGDYAFVLDLTPAPSHDQLVEALRAAGTELRRLRFLHLRQYEGKVGEPSPATLAKIDAALSSLTEQAEQGTGR